MAENELVVQLREGTGKGIARKLRAAGRIPGVCYGPSAPSIGITLDPRTLERLLASSSAGLNTLIDLHVEGGGAYDRKPMLVKELQRDPVSGGLLHADLYALDLQQEIQVSVPIQVIGTAAGIKMGGILDQTLREIELECMPAAIPQGIPVDVSNLDIGQSLHVRDLELPGNVTLISDPDLAVVLVAAPTAEEEAPVEAAAEEGVEPAAEEAAEAGEPEAKEGDD
ncbi:MAG: 50S ribosomal protein L25 [Myxococcales bacterium]|nr:50S ribosomal protein L25 [Myxococcales bacterium]